MINETRVDNKNYIMDDYQIFKSARWVDILIWVVIAKNLLYFLSIYPENLELSIISLFSNI